MANNLKQPLEDPPSSPSSEEEEEEQQLHTIFSSEEEDEPEEDPTPRSGSSESELLIGRKRISTNVSTSNVATKKMYTQQNGGGKTGTNTLLLPCTRLFSEKDEIVLLQGIIDSKGENPLEDKRSFYESVKGSISVDATLDQFKDKIRGLKRKYTKNEMRGGVASYYISNPHEQKCFQLSKAIWGAEGIASESAISTSNCQSKESERGFTKKRGLVTTSRRGKNNVQEDGSKRRGVMKKKKKSRLVEKESAADWDESCFFLGMDFLKEKWNKVPPTESKKETQEKMKKLHANELECQKFEEMLKVMKDKCAHDKVELLNEVTSLIMAAD